MKRKFKTFCHDCKKEVSRETEKCKCGSQTFFVNKENIPVVNNSTCLKCGEKISLIEISTGCNSSCREYSCTNKECDYFLVKNMFFD